MLEEEGILCKLEVAICIKQQGRLANRSSAFALAQKSQNLKELLAYLQELAPSGMF